MKKLKIPMLEINATVTKMVLVDHELFISSRSSWGFKYYNIKEKVNQLVKAMDDYVLNGSLSCVNGELVISVKGYETVSINMFETKEVVLSSLDSVLAGIYSMKKDLNENNIYEKGIGRDCFSYLEFVKIQLDSAKEAFSPTTMIRKALESGAPDKGDILESKLRNACESVSNTQGYYRSKSACVKGYMYGKCQG